MKESAGVLLYRFSSENGIEVMLVHASGNYNRKSPWGIPKGEREDGENFEEAARRETLEETGLAAENLSELGFIEYKKSRKRVHCFAAEAPADASPRCASWEIDACEFLSLAQARKLIHPDQLAFIERLEKKLENKI